MSEASKIIPLRPETVPADKMLVMLTVGELREIIGEVVEQKLRSRVARSTGSGLLNADQAAEFLGYSRHWVYKNWQKIGGKKIGGRGVRFDAVELQTWVESRKSG
jgi:predicted DNA-binding transcriptional regulator AlpA